MAKWIDISTSKHQLKLFDGNSLIKTYPIAVGKMLTPTPSGTYNIINKDPNPGGPFGVLDGVICTTLWNSRNKQPWINWTRCFTRLYQNV